MDWYYEKGGQQRGPVSGTDLLRMLSAKMLDWNSRVWHEGLRGWTRAAEVEDLRAMRTSGSGWRDNQLLTRLAALLVGFVGLLLGTEVWAYARLAEILRGVERGIVFSRHELTVHLALQRQIAELVLGLAILATVAFIAWFRRSYQNLGLLGTGGLQSTPGWATGAWFVPGLNLVRPYRIAREMWTVSRRAAAPGDPAIASHGLVDLWWGLGILSLVIAATGAWQALWAGDAATLRTIYKLLAAADLLMIGSLAVQVRMTFELLHAQTSAAVDRGLIRLD